MVPDCGESCRNLRKVSRLSAGGSGGGLVVAGEDCDVTDNILTNG